jgi:phage terminase small subunit
MPVPKNLDEAERLIWAEVVHLVPPAVLRLADRDLLVLYCQSLIRYRATVACQKTLAARDPLEAAGGPIGRELDRLALLVLKLASELGLTPQSRTRILAGAETGAPDRIETPEFLRRFGPLTVLSGGKRA